MELLSGKVYWMCLILYGLFLLLLTIWNLKIIYENYQNGRSFQNGYNKTVTRVVVCAVVFFQFLIASVEYRLFLFALILGLHLLFLFLLARHNKANHTGDTFLLLDHEIKRMERRMLIGFALLFSAWLFIYLEGKYWYR